MHDVDHHHHHHHEGDSQLSDKEKLVKRIEHWIKHNEDHKKTYLEWAEKTRGMGLEDVANALEEVVSLTDEQNRLFEKILNIL